MFPYYVPAGIGLLFTVLSGVALVQSDRCRRRWPWMVALVAALLLWVPALVLFTVAPAIWPQATHGRSDAYYQLMGWQTLWIFLGIPVGLIAVLVFMSLGRRRQEVR